MATVIVDAMLVYARRRRGTVLARSGQPQAKPVWGSAFYRRWAVIPLSWSNETRCVHSKPIHEACKGCFVLDRAHYDAVYTDAIVIDCGRASVVPLG